MSAKSLRSEESKRRTFGTVRKSSSLNQGGEESGLRSWPEGKAESSARSEFGPCRLRVEELRGRGGRERSSACDSFEFRQFEGELTRLGEVLTVTLLDSFDRDTNGIQCVMSQSKT